MTSSRRKSAIGKPSEPGAVGNRGKTFRDRFRSIAAWISCAFGSPWALATAVAVVVIWAASGNYFGYSDGWQLVINTGTTIVTFLMAFLIQATQYRESKAVNLKIDELLRAYDGARTGFINLDNMSDQELDDLATELERLGKSQKIGPVRNATSLATSAQPGKLSRKRRRTAAAAKQKAASISPSQTGIVGASISQKN